MLKLEDRLAGNDSLNIFRTFEPNFCDNVKQTSNTENKCI